VPVISTSNDCEALCRSYKYGHWRTIILYRRPWPKKHSNIEVAGRQLSIKGKRFYRGNRWKCSCFHNGFIKVSQVVENKKLISGGVRIRRITQLDALGSQKIKDISICRIRFFKILWKKWLKLFQKYVKIYTYPKFNGLCAPMPDGYAITISNYPRSGNGLTQGFSSGIFQSDGIIGVQMDAMENRYIH